MTQSDIINNNFNKAFECIKCSNAYDTGVVLSEEKLFKQISERKRSTFDKSKFTVVGSPTITDDGVASGFSASNYLDTLYRIDGTQGKVYKISIGYLHEQIPNKKSYLWHNEETTKGTLGIFVESNSKLCIAIPTDTNIAQIFDTINCVIGQKYYIEVILFFVIFKSF